MPSHANSGRHRAHALLAPRVSRWPESTEVNLLSWDEAVSVVGDPLYERSGRWSPDQLLDELVDTGWANPRGDLTPKELVLELGARSRVTRLVFDTAQAYTRERCA